MIPLTSSRMLRTLLLIGSRKLKTPCLHTTFFQLRQVLVPSQGNAWVVSTTTIIKKRKNSIPNYLLQPCVIVLYITSNKSVVKLIRVGSALLPTCTLATTLRCSNRTSILGNSIPTLSQRYTRVCMPFSSNTKKHNMYVCT